MPPSRRLTLPLLELLLVIGLLAGHTVRGAQTNSVYAWRTFSGHAGGAGNSDGPGSAARFSFPWGVAVKGGSLYVADTYNNTIRKVTANGLVTTLAGSPGEFGSDDGVGTDARFSSPADLALDAAGNIYVADFGNSTIRKISTNGTVTTLAGSAGHTGSADGTGGGARFSSPAGIAVDNAGNIFVADAGNSTIRKITSSGAVTTLAGSPGRTGSDDGTNSGALFFYPTGAALDPAGNIFVADQDNQTIRKITPDGTVSTLAGSVGVPGTADGTNDAAQFFFPSSLTVDSAGNIYVANTGSSTIRKVTVTGAVTTVAGYADETGSEDGPGNTARFYCPSGVAADQAGNVFIADTYNSTLRQLATNGMVSTVAGTAERAGGSDASGAQARFNAPYGVAVSGSTVVVADTFNHTIRKISASSLVGTVAGAPGEAGSTDAPGSLARFNNPYGIVADGIGNAYVADTLNHIVRKISSGGEVTTLAGSAGHPGSADGTNTVARFSSPAGIALASSGVLYVADFSSNIIRKVTLDGVVTTLAGSPGQFGTNDGTGSDARFSGPFGVAADASGNVYVSDVGNNTIRKITTNGVVTTLAGTAGQPGSADGTNSSARFYQPAGLALDGGGNLCVADVGNHTIRKVNSGGVVTTIAGSAGHSGSADGIGSSARFYYPFGIACDSANNLYVADVGNNEIRKVTSSGVVSTIAGSAGLSGSEDVIVSAALFNQPFGVALDSQGNVFVTDTYNGVVRKVASDRAVSTIAGTAGFFGHEDDIGSAARFSYPLGIGVDNAGNAYVADSLDHTIRKVTADGAVTTLAGSPGLPGSADGTGSDAQFSYPSGLAVNNSGEIFVADNFNHTIRKVSSSSGAVVTWAGSAGAFGSADSMGNDARFWSPNGVAVDSAGNVFVADSGNSTIRKISADRAVTTIAGSPGLRGSIDGVGEDARFDFPFGITVDGAGNLYVADAGNSTIRKITSDGIVTTIGGMAGVIGGQDGNGISATFSGPAGIALDTFGRIYVADTGNNRISRSTPMPMLSISSAGGAVVIRWPSASTGFVLQESAEVSNTSSWTNSNHSASDDGTNKTVTVPSPADAHFFRLSGD